MANTSLIAVQSFLAIGAGRLLKVLARREAEVAQWVFVEERKGRGSFEQDLTERTWRNEAGGRDHPATWVRGSSCARAEFYGNKGEPSML